MSLQFQDAEFAGLSGGRIVRIAVNPDYQGVRTRSVPHSVNPAFWNNSTWLTQACLPDGLRLQSSAAAADVLRGEVSHHGWKHGLKYQRDHLSQQWGDPVNRHHNLIKTFCSPDGEDLMSLWWTEALLCSFLMQAVSLLEEVVTPRKELPPLLLKLSERRAERLDYLGVSYGLTTQLLR